MPEHGWILPKASSDDRNSIVANDIFEGDRHFNAIRGTRVDVLGMHLPERVDHLRHCRKHRLRDRSRGSVHLAGKS